ncbi:hypothetical protein ACHAPT_011176 [Fusarium lateritium]
MSEPSPVHIATLVMEDPDVVGSRPPNSVVRKAGDLTRDEKHGLLDLLQKYREMPGQGPDLTERELYKKFFDDIFKFWTSSNMANQAPVLRPRAPLQSRIQVTTSCAMVGAKRSHDKLLDRPVFLTMKFDPEEETFA